VGFGFGCFFGLGCFPLVVCVWGAGLFLILFMDAMLGSVGVSVGACCRTVLQNLGILAGA